MPECDCSVIGWAIEINRRLFELVEQENHCSQQQNEKLHRHFHNCIEKKTESAGGYRPVGEIPLNLRLVGAEIRECQKKSAKDSRPKRVAPIRVQREIDRL